MLGNIGDNADAILTILASIASVVTAAGWLVERLNNRNRKRLNYRVHWNAPLIEPTDGEEAAEALGLALEVGGRPVPRPQAVVIRVENTGADLTETEFGRLWFSFGGRRVRHVVVAEIESELEDRFVAFSEAIQQNPPRAGADLVLPAIPMDRGHRFKLTLLLEGTGNRATDTVQGFWKPKGGGKIVPDDRRVRRSRRGLILGGATLALLGLVLGLIIVPSDPEPRMVAISCHPGTVTISGSTALEPAIDALATAFRTRCRDADPATEPQILIRKSASQTALDELVRLGTKATNQEIRRTRLVMFDGAAVDRTQVLARHTLGIGVFGIVAHRGAVPDGGLSTDEVQRLWNGRATTFDRVGGVAEEVKLVSRQEGSGTRAAFESTVLRGRPAAAPETSSDCNGLDPNPTGEVVHCVLDSTDDVLDVVNSLTGAIGYADVREAAQFSDVEVLRLDGHAPTEEDVASEAYPFWAVENLYTFGEPPAGTPLKDFLTFLATDEARAILTDRFGYLPCSHFSNSAPARACASK